jgi:hypothetical protein
MKRWTAWMLIGSMAAIFSGCQTAQLPPPLATADQIDMLNARTGLVQTLKTRGRISIEWVDRDGSHRQSADARLLLRRAPARVLKPGVPEADVLLVGSFEGSSVFEMGVNEKFHWSAYYTQSKRAYVGRTDAAPGNAARGAPFRADRVLELLGLTELDAASIRMKVQDSPGVNVIDVFSPGPNAWKQRTITVDRFTGDITAMQFYRADGSLEATATLADYHTYEGARDGVPSGRLRLPYKVYMDQPDTKGHVELVVDPAGGIKVNASVPEDFSELPDFKAQGLPVIDVDQPVGNP